MYKPKCNLKLKVIQKNNVANYTKCENNYCSNLNNKLHTCPFKEDIHGDYDALCNCCEDCADHCRDDI